MMINLAQKALFESKVSVIAYYDMEPFNSYRQYVQIGTLHIESLLSRHLFKAMRKFQSYMIISSLYGHWVT